MPSRLPVCQQNNAETSLQILASSSPPGSIKAGFTRAGADGAAASEQRGVALGTSPTALLRLAAFPAGAFDRAEGQLVYENGRNAVTVSFHLVANTNGSACQAVGTATPA